MSTTRELSELVSERLKVKWPEFAARHPALAAAIEPVRLIETAVERLVDDADYRAAMDAAARDEAALEAGRRVMRIVDRWIDRALGLL